MGKKFIGVKEALPLALCEQGANQHAHVLLTKSVRQTASHAPPPEPVPENTDMDIKALKAIALMTDVTKAHFIGLDDAAATAFLAKSTDEQKAEAETAKAAKDAAEAEAAALATGKSAREIALEKRLDDQAAELAAMKARDADRDLEARAAKEFAGYPGGTEAAVKMLRSASKLDEEARADIEKGMQDRISANKALTRTLGYVGADKSTATPASDKIAKATRDLSEKEGVTLAAASYKLSEDPAFAADFTAAQQEQNAA